MTLNEEALSLHRKHRGKISVTSKVPLRSQQDLSLAYTPGVAAACRAIAGDEQLAYEYTIKGNLVAVVSDGTAVLGLGDIGPAAAMPVMEGKALLFKKFAGVDAVPICIRTKSVDEIVSVVKALEPTFGGINLEDIAAPRCFEVEQRLRAETEIPIFHDDQHGTAVVVLAALVNAAKVVNKRFDDLTVVISGAGSAGTATANLLLARGVGDVIMSDRNGPLCPGVTPGMNAYQAELAQRTNIRRIHGTLADALDGADAFIGVSAGNLVTPAMVRRMAIDPIVIAMANPIPEIMPDEARAGGARVIGTGRSDYPNQVNNVLAFPGIMRGALATRARVINEEMKIAAAEAISSLVTPDRLAADYIIPEAFDPRVGPAVAAAVAASAMASGAARVAVDPEALRTAVAADLAAQV
ncbi:MAG: NAD(P)-dependent malic enzyme [Chloroflexota bacterium]